jgi:hypothetical protein
MNLLRAWFAGIPAYLWSGWGAIASLLLLLAAWEGVSLVYGSLILPDPASTFAKLRELFASGAPGPSWRPPRAAPWPGWRWRSSPAACSGSLPGCR